MTIRSDGWEDFLAPGETILWQGRPGRGILWRQLVSLETLVGCLFIGFALLWISATTMLVLSFDQDEPFRKIMIFFPFLGVIVFGFGLYAAVGRVFVDAYLRERTWYSLTDKGAFIATQGFGRRTLRRYDITEMRGFELQDGAPGTVWFAMEQVQYRRAGQARSRHAGVSRGRRIGFVQIDDPLHVWSLMAPHRAEAAG